MVFYFRIIFAVFFIINIIVRYYHHYSNRLILNKEIGHEGIKHSIIKRLLIGIYIIVSLFYIFLPDYIDFLKISYHDVFRWLGVLIVLPATFLLVWSFKTLGKYYVPSLKILKNHKLIKDGPYKWIRHPIYLSELLGGFGLALLAQNVILIVIAIVSLYVILFLRMPIEEKMLINTFGNKYKEYMKSTERLFPKIMKKGR